MYVIGNIHWNNSLIVDIAIQAIGEFNQERVIDFMKYVLHASEIRLYKNKPHSHGKYNVLYFALTNDNKLIRTK